MASKMVFTCDWCGRVIEERLIARDANTNFDRYIGNHSVGSRKGGIRGYTFHIMRCDIHSIHGGENQDQLCEVCIGNALREASALWDEKLRGGDVICPT